MYKFNFYHTRKENFFRNKNERETAGLVGYLRGHFGRLGDEFYHSWFDVNPKLKSEKFHKDANDVMEFLRERLLTNRAYMRSFVYGNKEMKIDDASTDSYGMFVESDGYEYDIRAICDDGNYDCYIYCYDKRFQEPQYLNARRFRDEHGKLTETVEEIGKKTLTEARNYYIDGDRYENNGKIYTFRVTDENMMFECGNTKWFVAPELMGTYLPDVASEGNAFVKVPMKQTLENLTLGDLLKSVNLTDVHIVHDEVDIELATIVELHDNMLTPEGKEAWSDVLNARVKQLYPGGYGVHIEVSDVDHKRLSEFSFMLAGQCPADEYEKWVNEDDDQEQNIDM